MTNNSITAAIIGGTGLNEFQHGDVHGQRNTPFGSTSADIVVSNVANRRIAFLARHGSPHQIAPHKINYRANIWALKQLGVNTIVAVNAVGGIRADLPAGALVIPDQLIDYTYGREHTYYDGRGYDGEGYSYSGGGPLDSPLEHNPLEHNSLEHRPLEISPLEHCEFSYPFTDRLRTQLLEAANDCRLPVADKAVYGVTQGPRLESAAEIDRLERDGCDIVGMTAMPEAALARELSLEYASLCVVVNPAAGRSDGPITMDEIRAVLDRTMIDVRQWLAAAMTRI